MHANAVMMLRKDGALISLDDNIQEKRVQRADLTFRRDLCCVTETELMELATELAGICNGMLLQIHIYF